MGEDDRANTVFARNPSAFRERASHYKFKKSAILRLAIYQLDFVLHRLGSLWRQRIVGIERVV
jgi:hypothetical protein